MLIQLDNLDVGYGSRKVLRDVNLKFNEGCAGLLGPNGAGKSSLLKTIMGFIQPLGGEARILGLEIPRHAMQVRSRIGYMPESESFIAGISAVQYVAYMARLSGLPKSAAIERAHEVLQYVGLEEARYRNLETYSLGMKQRAKLAQAIVHDPALLLLDEPTNGMDPDGRSDMLELVEDLSRKKGMAIILCSHLLTDVESVADQIIVLGNGQVVSRQVGAATASTDNRGYLIILKNNPAEFATALEARGWQTRVQEDGLSVMAAGPAEGASTRDLFDCAAQTGNLIRRLEERRERLQDVFVKAVGELGNAHL